MGKTSTEVKQRWMKKAYSRYVVNLRHDTDKHLINYIEKHKEREGTTNIFRNALEDYVEKE